MAQFAWKVGSGSEMGSRSVNIFLGESLRFSSRLPNYHVSTDRSAGAKDQAFNH